MTNLVEIEYAQTGKATNTDTLGMLEMQAMVYPQRKVYFYLKKTHPELDFAVERIYRAEPFHSDEERLEHLFKLYSKMTKK